jgi:hypothetical protein
MYLKFEDMKYKYSAVSSVEEGARSTFPTKITLKLQEVSLLPTGY